MSSVVAQLQWWSTSPVKFGSQIWQIDQVADGGEQEATTIFFLDRSNSVCSAPIGRELFTIQAVQRAVTSSKMTPSFPALGIHTLVQTIPLVSGLVYVTEKDKPQSFSCVSPLLSHEQHTHNTSETRCLWVLFPHTEQFSGTSAGCPEF